MTKSFNWKTGGLTVYFVVDENDIVNIGGVEPAGKGPTAQEPDKYLIPMHQLRLQGDGNFNGSKTSKALLSSYQAARLKYVSYRHWTDSEASYCEVMTKDEESGLNVSSKFTVFKEVPVLRAWTAILNISEQPISLTSLPSLVVGGLTRASKQWWQDYTIHSATNTWFREAQWRSQSLPDVGIDNFLADRLPASFVTFGHSNQGSFSSGSHLPMGMLYSKKNSDTWLWQIENNGSWKWEIGDWGAQVYVALSGPTKNDHDSIQHIGPGQMFTTVPTALCHVHGNPDAAFQALTQYRRYIRRLHTDNVNLPVIFNDYMNCLMGDPDETKIRSLIGPAVEAGAEYFVIDAGWYSNDSNWWDDIGEWKPSARRFPSGFGSLLRELKEAGLIPGLWIEPESIGIKCKLADTLPPEAFFQQNGKRITERDRYQLDFRHQAVKEHLDQVIERLVTDLGVGYFKFDYNIEIVQGTDVGTLSPGAAHLEHNRAYLAWIHSLLDRYPGLVIENCSSGAQRMDYAMLSAHPIQSTSDQEDPVHYSAIAAAVFTAVTPEQGATWVYPQREWSDEINALTVVNSLLGRVHLSGRLDQLSPPQFGIIKQGIQVYKSIRNDIKSALPFWPLGLPKWHDEWLAYGLVCRDRTLLAVWRRGGDTTYSLPVSHLARTPRVKITLLYPNSFKAETNWDDKRGLVKVRLPNTICARLFQLEETI